MPQSIAAISLKMTIPKLLTRFGYRRVLMTNTILLGLVIACFATIHPGTPKWLIVAQAFAFGFFSSCQFTSMNTLVYTDVEESDTSMASTIASTLQQLSMSFGVACASLMTALFIHDRFHVGAPQMIRGIHLALLCLGGITIVSTLIFSSLKDTDGDNISLHKVRSAEA
jgi:MFS family permease